MAKTRVIKDRKANQTLADTKVGDYFRLSEESPSPHPSLRGTVFVRIYSERRNIEYHVASLENPSKTWLLSQETAKFWKIEILKPGTVIEVEIE